MRNKEKIITALKRAAFALFVAIGFAAMAILAFSLAGVLLYPLFN